MKDHDTIKSLKGANLLDPKNTPLKANATINERMRKDRSYDSYPMQKDVKDTMKVNYHNKRLRI